MGCWFHDWDEWKEIPGKCIRERKCKKCTKTQTEDIDHDFGKWTFISDNSCKQLRTCKVCGFTENKIEHNYGDWHYYEDECCTMKKACSRCGDVQFKQKCPKRVIIKEDNRCIEKSICPQCKDTQEQSIDHIWEESISNYKVCLNYVIKIKTSKVNQIQTEMDYILKNTKGDTTDLKYLKLAEEIANLQRDILVCNIKLNSASQYTNGKVCKRCHYIEKIGRKDHFDF